MKMFKHIHATNYGIDISRGRLDSFDKEIIKYAFEHKGRRVAVNIGCGAGKVSIILALIGFDVWLYDIDDLREYYARVGEVLGIENKLHFTRCDIRDMFQVSQNITRGAGQENVCAISVPNDIAIAISQRVLHHVPYPDAECVINGLYKNMIANGKLFLSVSGVECKFAGGYTCAREPIERRFCDVGDDGEIYSVYNAVCLYTQSEVVHLLQNAGFIVQDIETTRFGNHRVIVSK